VPRGLSVLLQAQEPGQTLAPMRVPASEWVQERVLLAVFCILVDFSTSKGRLGIVFGG
jgi:hypothetical protein